MTDQTVSRKALDIGYAFASQDRSHDELEAMTAKQLLDLGASEEQAPIKNGFIIGYMVNLAIKKVPEGELDYEGKSKLVSKATAMYFARGKDTKDENMRDGEVRRDQTWHDRWNTAKTKYSRLMTKHGVKTDEARGGKREGSGVKASEPDDVKASEPRERRVPKLDNIADASKWLLEETAALVAFVSTNHDYLSERIGKLTDDYRKAIVAALAE